MYQSLNLKYNFVNCIIQTYHACISFEFNLSISWLFPRDIPCQEDALSLLSYLIFIILILRQAWKSRTVIKSPSGFAESLWRLEKGLGKDNLQQIHSFQIRFSNMTSLRETGQALLLKSLQIYCCIHDLTTNMRYCLLPSAAQDADALPSAANWHQRGEQAPMMCCGSCVAHVADKPFPFGSFGGAVCLFVFALFSCVFFVCFAFFCFLAPERWVGFWNLLHPVITRCLTDLVTAQDLGMHGGRKGYFTLPAISLFICLLMFRSRTTAERSVWGVGSAKYTLLMEAQKQLLSQTRPSANQNSQNQEF